MHLPIAVSPASPIARGLLAAISAAIAVHGISRWFGNSVNWMNPEYLVVGFSPSLDKLGRSPSSSGSTSVRPYCCSGRHLRSAGPVRHQSELPGLCGFGSSRVADHCNANLRGRMGTSRRRVDRRVGYKRRARRRRGCGVLARGRRPTHRRLTWRPFRPALQVDGRRA